MLFYGDGKFIPDDCIIMNLNSMKEGYPRFRFLLPPMNIGKCGDWDYDLAYFNYLFGNVNAFTEFFSIIYELYLAHDLFILIDENMDWSENIAESLFKAIQQRYGYNAIRIASLDDYIFAKNSMILPQFNQEWGIYNLDIDKERYSMIIELNRLRAGGTIEYE